MAACFWRDYINTREECGGGASIDGGVVRFKTNWPEYATSFPNPASELNGTDDVTFITAFDEITPPGSGSGTGNEKFENAATGANTAEGPRPPGVLGGPPAITQPLDPTVNLVTEVFKDMTVGLPAGTLPAFISGGNEDIFSPDWLDVYIDFPGAGPTDTITPSVVSEDTSNSGASPLTVQFIEDATGQWRVRVTGLEDVDLATQSGGSFTYADWATNGPYAGCRWAFVEVQFVVNGGAAQTFRLAFQWQFTGT